MLGIKHQGAVHYLFMQLAWCLTGEHFQKIATYAVLRRTSGVNAHTVVTVAIPVADNGRQHGQQGIGFVLLLGKVHLLIQITQHRAAGAHYIHGVRMGRNFFQHPAQGFRQAPAGHQVLLVSIQLGLSRQLALQQQMRDFFKLGMVCQVGNVVAPVSEAGTAFAHCAQRRGAGTLATQARAAQLFFFLGFFSKGGHGWLLVMFWSRCVRKRQSPFCSLNNRSSLFS